MAVRVQLTTAANGDTVLRSPYDAALVEHLKAAIPYGARTWESASKTWRILAIYDDDLLTCLAQVGADIHDTREQQIPAQGSLVPVPVMPEDLREAFDTLTLAYNAPLGAAEAVYKFYVKYSTHTDVVGGTVDFHRLNDAMATIRKYLNPPCVDDAETAIPF